LADGQTQLTIIIIIILITIIIMNAYNVPTSKSRRCTAISTMTIIIIEKLTHARTQLAIQPIITTFTQQSSAINKHKHSISLYNQPRSIHKSRLRKVLAEEVCLQHGFER